MQKNTFCGLIIVCMRIPCLFIPGFLYVCVCVYRYTCTYLLLHRAPLHSQSPVCCMRDPGLHNSWLHPYLTEIYSEEREDTSFLFGLGLSHTFFSSLLLPGHSKVSLSLFPFLLHLILTDMAREIPGMKDLSSHLIGLGTRRGEEPWLRLLTLLHITYLSFSLALITRMDR